LAALWSKMSQLTAVESGSYRPAHPAFSIRLLLSRSFRFPVLAIPSAVLQNMIMTLHIGHIDHTLTDFYYFTRIVKKAIKRMYPDDF